MEFTKAHTNRISSPPPLSRARRALLIPLIAAGAAIWATTGDAHAAGIVRSVEYVEIVIGSGSTSNSANLTKNQDAANAVPFASMMATSGASTFARLFTDVYLTAGSPATVTVERNTTGGTVTVGVYVVEFDPSFVKVQQGTFSVAGGNPSGTAAIPVAVDTARAAMVFYSRTATTGGYDDAMLQGQFSTASQLQFTRDGTSSSADGHWYVFEALNNGGYAFTVQTKNFSAGGGSGSAALTPNVAASDTMFVGSYRTSDGSTEADLGAYRLLLNCPGACTQVRALAYGTGGNINATAFIITFASGIQVQRGVLDYDVNTQATTGIAAVDLSRTMVWNGGANGPGTMRADTGNSDEQPTAHQRIYLLNTTSVRGNRGLTDDIADGTFEAVEFELAPDDVYYSIGTNGGNLRTGTPLISITGGVATLDTAQVGNVGVGDEIDYDGDNKKVYIKYVVSQTEFGVHTNDGSEPPPATNLTLNAIRRTFSSVLTAESQTPTGSYLGTADLTTANVRVHWVVYNDGALNVGAARVIDGYTTDAGHYVTLTAPSSAQVASGVTQRHDGTAGTGARMVASANIANILLIQDDYFRVEWLELDGNADGFRLVNSGVHVNGPAEGIVVRDLVVHDVGSNGWSAGIELFRCGGGGDACQVYNNFVYDIVSTGFSNWQTHPAYGIVDTRDGADATIEVFNNTVFKIHQTGTGNNDAYGIAVFDDAGRTVRNNVVIDTSGAGGGLGQDFCAYSADLPDNETCHVPPGLPASATQNFNMSSDASATGASSITGEDTGEFLSVANGSEDLHLALTADALGAAADLSSSFTHDIDGGLRAVPWDLGADDDDAVTAVELLAFQATALDSGIELEWETGAEINNLGFHLYRALGEAGPYARITSRVIPGLGSSPAGASYRYRDAGLSNGTTYFYRLEDIETTGRTEMHGPVSATPEPGAHDSGAADEDDAASGTDDGDIRITYGNPAANRLDVRRGRRHIVIELITEGFYAIPNDDGSVSIEIPGFESLDRDGLPSIPVKNHWIEAVAGRGVELDSVRAHSVVSLPAAWILAAASDELVAARDGVVRSRRRSRRIRAGSASRFAHEAGRIETVGFMGATKKALLSMSPVWWGGPGESLQLSKRLVVRVSFDRVDSSENAGRGRFAQRSRPPHADNGLSDVIARLVTSRSGLHGVRFEDLFPRSRTRYTHGLELSRQGAAIPFHVEPRAKSFGPGSTLYFLSDPPDANPYGRETVYELRTSSPDARRMVVASATPSASAGVDYAWHELVREENRFYQAALVNAPDLWLWELLLAPVTKSFDFTIDHLARVAEPSRLDVWLQGTSDLSVDPDHHVRLFVNGVFVAEERFDGKSATKVSVDLPFATLSDGVNQLEIDNVGDTGAAYSTIMLDRFTITYPRRLVAEDGILEGTWSASGRSRASGTESPHLVDVTEPRAPRWLEGGLVSSDGFDFHAEAGRRYLLTNDASVKRPEVVRPKAPRLASPTNRADYLIITPRAFLGEVQPLLSHRSQQGLVAKGVAIEDVFSEFGYGEATPEALRSFLGHTFHHWSSPSPRYVLLVGDATYDFKDFLGTGVVNHVPAMMVKTSHLWIASDPMLAAVNGDDTLPDMAIGRLPAASVEQARSMIQKILAYESGLRGVVGPSVLVADNPDSGGDFVADAETAARLLPSGASTKRIYLSELGPAASKAAIIDAFDTGTSLMSYVGHGGIHLWASENIFNSALVPTLLPQSQQPLLLTMNCLNGYFNFPHFDSLAEALLKPADRGVIAAFSPTGLSVNRQAQALHRELLRELHSARHRRLGDAIAAAQSSALESGASAELLIMYHLLGDPALVIR